MARPPVCSERLSLNAEGLVQYQFKRPWKDGRTHVVLSPLEFMEKLSALVPLPYLNLTRYSGILAPNSKYRSKIIPGKTRAQIKKEQVTNEVPILQRWAKFLARVFMIDVTKCSDCGGEVKVIAVIFEISVIQKILSHEGIEPQPPPQAPAHAYNLGLVSLWIQAALLSELRSHPVI